MSEGINWVVTGGCGFIGANLVNRLCAEDGHTVRVVDDLSTGRRDYLEIDSEVNPAAGDGLEPLDELPGGELCSS